MRYLVTILLLAAGTGCAHCRRHASVELNEINRQLAGQVVDYTHNHGSDHRIYSEVLCQCRDLYVYLPPGYTPSKAYPLILWLHGGFSDERALLEMGELGYLDALIRRGCCPPVIVACSDGTCSGRGRLLARQSFYVNSSGCGRFQDHVMCEVIPFLTTRYSIRADREAHAVVGGSLGGFGAMNLGIKHRDFFGSAAALSGAVNLRYDTSSGDYTEDFDPATYRWRTRYYRPGLVAGAFRRLFVDPIFGPAEGAIQRIARENPADLLFTTDLQPGQLDLLIAYGDLDQFNMDAQAESFWWLARQRGISVDVVRYPEGDHSEAFFRCAQRDAYRWLAARLPRPAEQP